MADVILNTLVMGNADTHPGETGSVLGILVHLLSQGWEVKIVFYHSGHRYEDKNTPEQVDSFKIRLYTNGATYFE